MEHDESIVSDREVRKLFKDKKSKAKPILNLDEINNSLYASSDSEISENF